MLLASALFFAGDNAPWLLSTNVSLSVEQLELMRINDKEYVHLTVDVRSGPTRQRLGSISRNLSANEVRAKWTSTKPEVLKKKIAIKLAQDAKGQLDNLYTEVEQLTWSSWQTTLHRAYKEKGASLGVPVTGGILAGRGSGTQASVVLVDEKFTCSCSAARLNPNCICPHIAYTLITGDEKYVFNYASITKEAPQTLKIPIGFGMYWAPVSIARAVDDETNRGTSFLFVNSRLEKSVLRAMDINYLDDMVIQEDEGILGYIKYLEELIMSTSLYTMMSKMSGAAIAAALATCKKKHNTMIADAIRSGASVRNNMRQAWIICNVASLIETEICFPCRQVSDTPEF